MPSSHRTSGRHWHRQAVLFNGLSSGALCGAPVPFWRNNQKGQIIILKRNKPKYMLINLDESPIIEMTDDEKIDFVAARILKKYHAAFEELAK